MLYTINEYAEKMRVSRVTVYSWIKDNLLEIEKTPSGKIRIIGKKEKVTNDK